MKLVLKIFGGVLAVFVLLVGVGYLWASSKASSILAKEYETPIVDFPIPMPLSDMEIAERGLGAEEAREVALAEAVERGKHLAEARYGCADCHGENFAGGEMMVAGPVATLLGPNLTLGEGGVTRDYTASDWNRAVRHGVLPDGTTSVMPAQDYQLMSDQELGDLVSYIRSFPPVDNTVEAVRWGPIGTFLLAQGEFRIPAEQIEDHMAVRHPVTPPPAEVTVEFGEHLAAVCVGCHTADFAGGDIGNPAWPQAANLTPDETGLAGWSYEDFRTAMVEGRSRDGRVLREPMTFVMPSAAAMTDVEMEAMWLYLQSMDPVERVIELELEDGPDR